jgi:hypothetical protein
MIFVLLATAAEHFALLKLCNKYDRIFLHISEDNIRTVQHGFTKQCAIALYLNKNACHHCSACV